MERSETAQAHIKADGNEDTVVQTTEQAGPEDESDSDVDIVIDAAIKCTAVTQLESSVWPLVAQHNCTPAFTTRFCVAACEAHRQGKLSKIVAAKMSSLVVRHFLATSTLPGPSGGPCMRDSDKSKLDKLEVQMDKIRESYWRRSSMTRKQSDAVSVIDPPEDREYWRLAQEQVELVRGNFDSLPSYNPFTARRRTKPSSVSDEFSILGRQELVTLHRTTLHLDMPQELSELLAKVCEECNFVQHEAYIDILLPYLREVTRLMKSHDIPPNNPDSRKLFTSVVKGYVLHYVQQEPTKPTSWRQAGIHWCDRDCSECSNLSRLLHSETETGRFSGNVGRRAHIEERLGLRPGVHSDTADFVTMTEKYGSPHKLIVMKTHKAFERRHAEWQGRLIEARKRIGEFVGDKRTQRAVLGDEYFRIMLFSGVRAPQARLPVPEVPYVDEADLRAVLAGDLTCLVQLPEPARARKWLQLCYVPDAESEEWLDMRYCEALRSEERWTEPRLGKFELLILAAQIFRGASNPSKHSWADIKGIRKRELGGTLPVTAEQMYDDAVDDGYEVSEDEGFAEEYSDMSGEDDEEYDSASEPNASDAVVVDAVRQANRATLADVTNRPEAMAGDPRHKRKSDSVADAREPPVKRIAVSGSIDR